ncbi:hypothetical protein G6F50_017472 [Rhizopus delemar]|uniref:Uncharacterized protein n=1 Tax=Rhizopus delemar TaxID=936053 RepID=A0A9P7C0J0_9FUNG|nr:hypothetical protein G6F50_017472 [Rhizopus delemar]
MSKSAMGGLAGSGDLGNQRRRVARGERGLVVQVAADAHQPGAGRKVRAHVVLSDAARGAEDRVRVHGLQCGQVLGAARVRREHLHHVHAGAAGGQHFGGRERTQQAQGIGRVRHVHDLGR